MTHSTLDSPAHGLYLRITPHGIIMPSPVSEPGNQWERDVLTRFSEHEAAGMVALAANAIPCDAGLVTAYWQDIAADFIRALCHLPEAGAQPSPVVELTEPTPARVAEWILNTPPMPGGEYISPDLLRQLWRRMSIWGLEQSEKKLACVGISLSTSPSDQNGPSSTTRDLFPGRSFF